MSAMPHREAEPGAAAASEETVLLEWTVHLLQREPQRGRIVFAAMGLAALAGVLLLRSPLFALVGVLVLFLATAEFMLPIRYRLTTRRACSACGANRLEIRWENVRRLLGGQTAVKLSPLALDTRLEAFRGVLLRFAPDGQPGDRQAVMQIVEERAAQASGEGGEAGVAGRKSQVASEGTQNSVLAHDSRLPTHDSTLATPDSSPKGECDG